MDTQFVELPTLDGITDPKERREIQRILLKTRIKLKKDQSSAHIPYLPLKSLRKDVDNYRKDIKTLLKATDGILEVKKNT